MYVLIYLFTPWNRVILEKIASSQLVKNIPAFYETRRFITAFTNALYMSTIVRTNYRIVYLWALHKLFTEK
jgi:hypothetical protein